MKLTKHLFQIGLTVITNRKEKYESNDNNNFSANAYGNGEDSIR